jgi:hypothetical protein
MFDHLHFSILTWTSIQIDQECDRIPLTRLLQIPIYCYAFYVGSRNLSDQYSSSLRYRWVSKDNPSNVYCGFAFLVGNCCNHVTSRLATGPQDSPPSTFEQASRSFYFNGVRRFGFPAATDACDHRGRRSGRGLFSLRSRTSGSAN